jgi:hypothetical protein
MKVGSCLITSDRTAAYTGMSSALVSHWRTLTIGKLRARGGKRLGDVAPGLPGLLGEVVGQRPVRPQPGRSRRHDLLVFSRHPDRVGIAADLVGDSGAEGLRDSHRT